MGEDDDVSQRFTEVYQRRFKVLLESEVHSVRRNGDNLFLEVGSNHQSQTVTAESLLLAVGRVPNTDTLDLARTGVSVDDSGFVRVDEYLQTNVPGIWAIGDIAGHYMLKHVGDLESAYAWHNMINPNDMVPVDYHAIPHGIFSSPQVAGVGLTEREAKERGIDYKVNTRRYDQSPYGTSIEDHDGFMKVLVDRNSGEILGCHIIGTHATTLIQEIAIIMRMRASIDSITKAVYVHPALPELVQKTFEGLA